MFAVDHAATALLLKRRYPSVPMTPLLLAVQAMEVAWVVLNYLGVEHTTTEAAVRSVADIHLADMPYSHSVATALGAALVGWAVLELGLGRRPLGRAVGLGIASHLVLDLLTHAHDIVLWPGRLWPRLGFGLYGSAPLTAFVVELAYGAVCWRIYRGGRGMLAFVLLGNAANLSLLSATVPGPEVFLAGRPLTLVTVIAAQIVVTLVLTGLLARGRHQRPEAARDPGDAAGARGSGPPRPGDGPAPSGPQAVPPASPRAGRGTRRPASTRGTRGSARRPSR